MMMARATIPLELKAGSIFKINLNLLVKVSSVLLFYLFNKKFFGLVTLNFSVAVF